MANFTLKSSNWHCETKLPHTFKSRNLYQGVSSCFLGLMMYLHIKLALKPFHCSFVSFITSFLLPSSTSKAIYKTMHTYITLQTIILQRKLYIYIYIHQGILPMFSLVSLENTFDFITLIGTFMQANIPMQLLYLAPFLSIT